MRTYHPARLLPLYLAAVALAVLVACTGWSTVSPVVVGILFTWGAILVPPVLKAANKSTLPFRIALPLLFAAWFAAWRLGYLDAFMSEGGAPQLFMLLTLAALTLALCIWPPHKKAE